jgi:nucleoside-diphosphate-sugar epimerase
MTKNVLETATRTPSVKRFVFTSSSASCIKPLFGKAYDRTPETWSDELVEMAMAPPPYNSDRILSTYAASKTLAEKELFKFMRENQPDFVANSVLPDFVCGPPLDLERQGYTSSIALFKSMWDNAPPETSWGVLQGQWMIDAADTGRLHLAALIHPDTKSERIFGFAHRKSWTVWIPMLRQWYPQHKFPDPVPGEPMDLTTITARPRAEALLKWLHGKGFVPMEESMRAVADPLVKMENQNGYVKSVVFGSA